MRVFDSVTRDAAHWLTASATMTSPIHHHGMRKRRRGCSGPGAPCLGGCWPGAGVEDGSLIRPSAYVPTARPIRLSRNLLPAASRPAYRRAMLRIAALAL